MPKNKIIVLSCGYVESHQVASTVFTLPEDHPGFDTKEEAVKDLSTFLFKIWKREYCSSFNVRCCKIQYDIEYGAHVFCTKCGTKLSTITQDQEELDETTISGFRSWIAELVSQDCDSLGSLFDDEQCWWPFNGISAVIGVPEKEIVCIREKAEILLCAALGSKEDFFRCCYDTEATFKQAVEKLC